MSGLGRCKFHAHALDFPCAEFQPRPALRVRQTLPFPIRVAKPPNIRLPSDVYLVVTSVSSASYHIISYHIISYHIISYHIISYHIISYHIISYHAHVIVFTLCATYWAGTKLVFFVLLFDLSMRALPIPHAIILIRPDADPTAYSQD